METIRWLALEILLLPLREWRIPIVDALTTPERGGEDG